MLRLFIITAMLLSAQVLAHAEQDDLTTTILNLDKKLFDAFNQRELEVFKALLSEDLEFYHDKSGLTNYQQNLKSTESMFNSGTDLRRELLPEHTEVYPIPNYGAIQTGRHKFCHTGHDGAPDCGVFKFLHIWQLQETQWQITRIMSYDH
ncbi:nuclear transport factor 2 family protein [Alkalimonas amylolytica]|uniref:DUF4440 domain-containing protein n=1 Tax=Alkalimonas amylolytica TaxID=152573 RepID=A0A1H4DW58_ALKAM|nr:nuclear transport factor 2 family protein [Alkalimonas amylolytica]SEA76748.1 protein of unknown function [Alkalimonas amylolytica]